MLGFDMMDRSERPEIEPHTWTLSSNGQLSWPVSSKGKADLIIFDPPYFDKKAADYDRKSISGLPKKEYLEFLGAFFALLKLNAKKKDTGCYKQVCDRLKTTGIKTCLYARRNENFFTDDAHCSCFITVGNSR